MFNIVLVEPRIPANTGNIARTCAVTGSQLHLVYPLGFKITDKQLKHAGLDYWHLLNVQEHDSLEDFFKNTAGGRYFYATSKAAQSHVDAEFRDNDYILFGREDAGLPETLLHEHPERCVRIPMIPAARCLNLSNSVAVIVYEALRQQGFENLKKLGQLEHFKW